MKNVLLTTLAVAALMACTAKTSRPSPQAFIDCGVSDAEHSRLMTLPQNDFDQDMQGGWRIIADKDGCNSVAGYLIEDYIVKYEIEPHTGSNILFWHVGQMHASSENYPRAKQFFSKSFLPDISPDEDGYEWALYAKGTVAFLEKDRKTLERTIGALSKIPVDPERIASIKKMQADNPKITFPKGFPEKPLNLIALEGLLVCFDEPYAKAYGNKCKANE